MNAARFPGIELDTMRGTRDALHAWSRILGAWLKSARARRKHWWQASLRPSLNGLTTGVVRGTQDFELELDLVNSQLLARMPGGEVAEPLTGQSAASLAAWLDKVLLEGGIDKDLAPGQEIRSDETYPDYSREAAVAMHGAFASVAAALEQLRAGIREETSPIQVWPHHFDLSMIWLPGPKIAGQDPANEEYADKQMNFGFVFGDGGIDEPYVYMTAYPLPDELPETDLPAGTVWKSEGFSGAVLLYKDLIAQPDPAAYLHELWNTLLAAGSTHLLSRD